MKPTIEPLEIKKILVINLGGIGDVLLSIPALRALRNLYPQAEISMLIPFKIYEIVKDLSYIDNIYIFNITYGGFSSLSGLLSNLKVLLSIRRKQFDITINMRTFVSQKSASKIKFILDIISPRIKVGRDTESMGVFFDIKIPETLKGQKYEMEYDIDTVKALGVKEVDRSIDIKITPENIELIKKILESQGIRDETILIGIHPGGMPSRRWGLENFCTVIEYLSKRISCKFVITGGKDEKNLGQRFMKMKDVRIINLIGRLNIKELFGLIKRCNLFISNDTGPIHIAAILKTPLVAIFGPGDIIRYEPRNISDKAMVLYKKADCAPCEKLTCKDLRCLNAITPQEVIEASLRLL